jgi:hypothetical protein
VMQEHLSTFLANVEARSHAAQCQNDLPRYVRSELEGFMSCGILASGFCRVVCQSCKQGSLVAYSCKARAVCPSCTGRRMSELAAHLADHVLPDVPIRQWVLSLPYKVRYLFARHSDLCREARGIFARAVQSFYCRRARDEGIALGRCGSVVHTQRFDSALRLDVHWHGLFLDGVYTGFEPTRPLAFHAASALTDSEVEWLVRHIRTLITGHLQRRGYLDEDAALVDESADELDELATHQAASIQGLIPFGDRSGQLALLFGEPPENPRPRPTKKLCADDEGYSLHAAVRNSELQTARRDQLCRYIARPALAQDRLAIASDGSIVYRFRRRWRNGKQAVVMDPMTFLSRLAAQIPPPRIHVLSYYGVLAPAASRRDEIVPGAGQADESVDCGSRHESSPTTNQDPKDTQRKRFRPERLTWAELIKRTWLVDLLRCPCGGKRKVLAMVFNPASIERILVHLGLPHLPPQRAPPRHAPSELPFE